MIQAVQDFLHSDRTTAEQAAVYFPALALAYALSFLYRLAAGPREARPKAERPAVTRRAGATASGFARWLAALPITPNQITVIGLVLVAFNCLLFLALENTFLFGTGLITAYLFDTLDGVVARAQGTSSRFGGYLDAVIDRYQEIFTFLAVGLVLGDWLVVLLILSGSLLTSYNKARVAIEVPTNNKGWPELMGKPMRLFVLCVGLIGAASLPWLLPLSLWTLAVTTHLTALERMVRAYFLIQDAETRPAAVEVD